MSLICPEDGSHLKSEIDRESLKFVSRCDICQGRFIGAGHLVDFRDEIEEDYRKLPARLNGGTLRCSFCKSDLFAEGGYYQCPMCHGCWLPDSNSKRAKIDDRAKAAQVAGEIVALLIVGIVLFGWQLGVYSSTADMLTQTSAVPLRLAAIVLWFVTFSLLFLVPASIYEQMVLSHRPHFSKALRHPLVRWLPIAVIGLMAINIYFLTP